MEKHMELGVYSFPSRFPRLAELYRATAKQAGHSGAGIKVSVGTLGLIAPAKGEAVERYDPGWRNIQILAIERRGWPGPDRKFSEQQVQPPFAYYVGDPVDVARRIVDLHQKIGRMRHFFQMDLGGLPQEQFLKSIELLATEVKPRVDRLMSRL
ncbi:hypothetical protein E2F48_07965 [Arthrobacter crusticola]|uniref:LLM class flavin-dependent oxidoreductase n=1 Tax=Arthrobacter crusticola TaxID=2547960 RepID=A0A4R5TVU9_9MICC|nr:hypothetical protein [Arthrobacter crusticola]TDK25212.1 hypothetical protein E2F48_07965 [Arthrobacter crusticola]